MQIEVLDVRTVLKNEWVRNRFEHSMRPYMVAKAISFLAYRAFKYW